jgi:hypothetical protein
MVAIHFHRPAPAPAAVLLPLLVLVPIISTPLRAEDGKWSPSMDWSGGSLSKYAVHMVLLPGDDNPYHSRVVWYRGENATTFFGGEWGWLTGNDGCTAFPTGSFAPLSIQPSGVDLFCSGSVGLSDGRSFFPGGTDPVTGSYGENKSRVLTRGTLTAASTWSPGSEMNDWRWYPSGTTLKDGRVFVGGGSRHRHHRMFGGRRDGAAPSSEMVERFAPVDQGQWDAAVLPVADPPPPATGFRPVPRESHSFVEMGGIPGFTDAQGRAAQILFGGRNASGQTLQDTWLPR